MDELPTPIDHGTMPWTGEFDTEGYALFECPICGRTVGLRSFGDRRYKNIDKGDFFAKHSAYVTLPIVQAAYDLEVWPQSPMSAKLIKRWKAAGGGPPFTISDVSVK